MALWLAAAVPVVLVPGTLSRFVLAKLLAATLVVLLATGVVAAGRLPRRVSALVVAGSVVLLLAAGLSAAPWAALVGRYPRYEGLVALPVYVGMAWAGARLLGPEAPAARARTVVTALSAASLLLGVVSALEAAGLRPLGGDVTRPGALLGNATDQGLVGALLLTVLIAAAAQPRAWPARLGAAAAVVTVVASGSRAALLGAAVGLLLVVWLGRRHLPGPALTRPAWPLGAAAALAVGAIALPATRVRVTAADDLAAQTVSGRWDIWSSTGALLEAHPWLGVGPSGFLDAYPAVQSATAAATSTPFASLDAPHAWPLQAAMAGGVPLLTLALALAAVVAAGLVGAARSTALGSGSPAAVLRVGAAAGVLGHAVALLTHPTGAGTTTLVALLAGAGLAVRPTPAPPATVRAHRWLVPARRAVVPAVRAWAATLVVVLTLGIAGERALEVASAHAATGEVAAADRAFTTAGTLRPWDPDVALVAALTFRAGAMAGDPASAAAVVRWAQRGLLTTPTSTELHLAAGAGLLVQGRLDEATPTLEAALDLAPREPMVHLMLGVAMARDDHMAGAERHLLIATESTATAGEAWLALAAVYDATGRDERATRARTAAAEASR